MIGELRALRERLARVEAALQRPAIELRDEGDLRLRLGRQPDGSWTARAFDVAGAQTADLFVPAALAAGLPGSPVEGQRIDLWASGTAGSGPVWWLTRRGALNGGTGAWAASGDPLVSTQSGSSTHSGAAAAMTNGPTRTIGPAGVYRVRAVGSAAIQSASLSDAVVSLGVNGTTVATLANATSRDQFDAQTLDGESDALTLAASDVLTLRVSTTNAISWVFGGVTPWRLFLIPREVRP